MERFVRTVELQLLRHGPPHNQLLSPLTNYLALCGDHPNTTLNFPLEHNSLKVRLRALRYQDSEETRKIQLFETADVVGMMLAEVPGLISELGCRDSQAETLVHLSIASTASELSLVPFEMTNAPPGFPGSGGSLSLQTEFPVCITRRSRKVRFDQLDWDVKPRILLVTSNAGGDVPLEAHYTVLRQLVEPWVRSDPMLSDRQEDLQNVHDHLVLLEHANVRTIRETMHAAIEEGRPFTHVHVLAHGCPLPNESDSFGVALHHPGNSGADAVDGPRLAQLFSGEVPDGYGRRLQRDKQAPIVVTLTVCDSGNTGFDVTQPGASVAFHIHEAGVPLVVGSQFPLTKGGSVTLTQSLYKQLLAGVDPRICLWEARRALFSQNSEKLHTHTQGRHDWASLVAFAAFPLDFEREVRSFERSQQRDRMIQKLDAGDTLLTAIDRFDEEFEVWTTSEDRPTDHEQLRTVVSKYADEVRAEVRRFDEFMIQQAPGTPEYLNLLGVSASGNKRAAELMRMHQKAHIPVNSPEESISNEVWLGLIRQSYRRYVLISRLNANSTWAFVQALFLRRFLTFYNTSALTDTEDCLFRDWFRAMYLVENFVLGSDNPHEYIWNLTDRIELGLLRLLIGRFQAPTQTMDELEDSFSTENIKGWLREMDRIELARGAEVSLEVAGGRRQLLRYRRYADMLYVDDDSARTSSYGKKRYASGSGGFQSLAAQYHEFADIYQIIEMHVREQIAISEIEAN